MLEITGKDISELNDTDLRKLIGYLCEAELRVKNLSASYVSMGGHQNAKDGGLDVRVEIPEGNSIQGFIPAASTGFQVKAQDLKPASIKKEICPKGIIRPVFQELAQKNGAYIIVCSKSSHTDPARNNRRSVMQKALENSVFSESLTLDFYDQERVAGWVRSHPSHILWVREKIGRPIHGWRAYDNWAKSPGGIGDEFLSDKDVRLYDGIVHDLKGCLPIIEGINRLRTQLSKPGSSVRLVGLSGVGKTRLVQALFDERIGENSLNSSIVFYTDISDNPVPPPQSFVENVIALQTKAIVVIDNCPPPLHHNLTSVCTAAGSLVSLITIEYDVREDLPEETSVFRLEPASPELIEKLIQIRFRHISHIDARTIAHFSGGNSRIAISLAHTVNQGETLTGLKNKELFRRLFHQRNSEDDDLLKTGEVCSLVYSFNSQTQQGANQELELLGSLVGKSVGDLHTVLAELKRRDLVQKRDVWMAILPHAIANMLAEQALENIPMEVIESAFFKKGNERLLTSFSKRLSYLHASPQAKQLSTKLLSVDGLLGDVGNLNELGITLLKNLAPVAQEAALEAIERAANGETGAKFTSRSNSSFDQFTHLLRSIAYESSLFERCSNLLVRFALSEEPDEKTNSIRALLKSLFSLYLSGTHASLAQRQNVVKDLVLSKEENKQDLGLLFLDTALETLHFTSFYGFEFGARSRNYGYHPATCQEVQQWYKTFLSLTESLIVANNPISSKAKILLANKFRGLLQRGGIPDELYQTTKTVSEKGPWNEGWIAIKSTIQQDRKEMPPAILEQLKILQELLKPNSLVEKARAYAVNNNRNSLHIEDSEDDSNSSDPFAKIGEITRSIGVEVAKNDLAFKELLPELIVAENWLLSVFGQGLAEGSSDPEQMWENLRKQFASTNPDKRNNSVLWGFLKKISLTNQSLAEKLFDNAVVDEVLSRFYPVFQTAMAIDEHGVSRLKASLELGKAPIGMYTQLAYGRVHESINDESLCDLLKIIASKQGGLNVAVEILYMRLHRDNNSNKSFSNLIISIGQELLSQVNFQDDPMHQGHQDSALGKIIEECFSGDSAQNNAKIVCNNIIHALLAYKTSVLHHIQLLSTLAAKQPIIFLDSFLGDDTAFERKIGRIFDYDVDFISNPLLAIKNEILINWCNANPERRYPVMAGAIVPYKKSERGDSLEWTSISLMLLDLAPDAIAVLDVLKKTFSPTAWSGSRANEMEKRRHLLILLKEHQKSNVANWAIKEDLLFEAEIKKTRDWEEKDNRNQFERFE